MIQTIAFGLLAGLLIGNGLPHFLKGIAGERYPTVFGSGPVVNFIGGWILIGLGAVALAAADLPAAPWIGAGSAAVGVLLFGLFHARGLAFGRE